MATATPVKSTTQRLLSWLNIALRIILVLFILILGRAIYKGLKQDGYILQAIQVPKTFNDNGYNGIVVASKIQDRILEIKNQSSRADSLQVTANLNATDLNLQVLGVGVSSSSLIYHIRDLLGVKTKSISGDLTQLNNELSLTLRLHDEKPKTIIKSYTDKNISQQFSAIINDAAEYILLNLDPYYLVADYYQNEKFDEAEELIREILANRPQDAKWAYLAWGNIKKSEDDSQGAIEMYKASIAKDPNFDKSHRSLAWTYIEVQNYQAAIPHFEAALKIDPTNFGSNNGLARCFAQLGNMKEAEKYYRANIEHNPNQIWAYGNYAGAIINYLKDTIRASQIYQEASERVTLKDDSYYVAQAGSKFFQGKKDSAITLIKKALEYNPNSVPGLQYYSSFMGNVKEDYAQAEQYYYKLARIIEEGSYDKYMKSGAYNSLAVNDYNLGKLDSAMIHVQKSINYLPSAALPYTTLGEIYEAQGKKALFYQNFEKAMELGLQFHVDWYKTPPYDKYMKDPKFQAILKKYELKG